MAEISLFAMASDKRFSGTQIFLQVSSASVGVVSNCKRKAVVKRPTEAEICIVV